LGRWLERPSAWPLRGANQKFIALGDAREIEVPIPPLNEQRRIVAKLDAIFERTRAARARLESLPAMLDQLRQSILAAAFRGDLTKDWREAHPDVEPASVLLERIRAERRRRWDEGLRAKGKDPKKATYEEPVPVDASELPELPAGWAWASIDQVADYRRHSLKAGPFGSALKKQDYSKTGYKVYGQEQVIAGDPFFGDYFVDEAKYRELESCAVCPGDLLVSLVGTVGRVLVLPMNAKPGIINPRLVKVSLAEGGLLPTALQRFLQSPFAKDRMSAHSHGGTMEILNLGILRSLPVPVAPIAEQRRLLEAIASALNVIEALESRFRTATNRVASAEQASLARAFRGELVPQDPNDEPASVLLERIRAARSAEPVRSRGRTKSSPPGPLSLKGEGEFAATGEGEGEFAATGEGSGAFAAKGKRAGHARSAPLSLQGEGSARSAGGEAAGTADQPSTGSAVERVVTALAARGQASSAELQRVTGLDAADLRPLLKSLERLGKVAVEGQARGTRYVWRG
jgi:type I restriction enzyme S subunit